MKMLIIRNSAKDMVAVGWRFNLAFWNFANKICAIGR